MAGAAGSRLVRLAVAVAVLRGRFRGYRLRVGESLALGDEALNALRKLSANRYRSVIKIVASAWLAVLDLIHHPEGRGEEKGNEMNDLTTITEGELTTRYFNLVEALRAAEHPAVRQIYIEGLNEIKAELHNRLAA